MTEPNTIIITGGAQRIGKAIALALQEDGYQVVVTYRTERPALADLRAAGINTHQADFSSDSGVQAFIDSAKQQFTRLRAIVHNASDWCAESDTLSAAETMQRMMQIHASAPYQINLALAPLLQNVSQVGDIIHMTDYVQETGSKRHIAYAASKSALHNLTLSFATLLAPHVKVNSIAPALLMFNDDDDEAYKKKALEKSLMQVCPGADEAVNAVQFLLHSDYMTGRCLSLDGGRHLK